MRKQILILLFCLSGLFACSGAPEAENVSMIQLIANSQKFDGRFVQVTAYLNLDFEGYALYLHKDDYEQHITSNAIWISLTDSQIQSALAEKINNSYVTVNGIFNAKHKGQWDLFQGALEQVKLPLSNNDTKKK